MTLVSVPIRLKKAPFWKKEDQYLIAKVFEIKIPVQETSGYYWLGKSRNSREFFLMEFDGKRVHISSFTLGYKSKPLWIALWVLDYDSIRNPKTKMIYNPIEISERYLP